MQLNLHQNHETIFSLKDQWNDLHNKFYHQSVFYTPEFIYSWYEAYSNNDVLIVTVEDEMGKLLLVAPLVKCNDGWLRIAGYKRADYNAILFDSDKPHAFNYFLEWITVNNFKLELTNVHAANKTNQLFVTPFETDKHKWLRYQLLKYLSPNLFTIIKTKKDCPYINVSNAGDVLTKINQSKSNQQRIAALSKLGALSYKYTHHKKEIEAILPVLFDMHITEWAAKQEKSLFLEKSNQLFYQLLSQNLSEGQVRLDMLYLDEKIVAMHFGFENTDTVYYYKPCYDLTYKKNSTGGVLLNFLIKSTLESGKTFDFLKGAEAYKNQYTNDLKTLIQIKVQSGFLLSIFRKAKYSFDPHGFQLSKLFNQTKTST
jgi:CelD/BcsL family acetyltransferase involved in cellulose biosynthesis